MPLSDLKIRKAKQKDKPYRLSDGLGLSLQVRPTGSKLWHFRYQFMGKEKILSIGQTLSSPFLKREPSETKQNAFWMTVLIHPFRNNWTVLTRI